MVFYLLDCSRPTFSSPFSYISFSPYIVTALLYHIFFPYYLAYLRFVLFCFIVFLNNNTHNRIWLFRLSFNRIGCSDRLLIVLAVPIVFYRNQLFRSSFNRIWLFRSSFNRIGCSDGLFLFFYISFNSIHPPRCIQPDSLLFLPRLPFHFLMMTVNAPNIQTFYSHNTLCKFVCDCFQPCADFSPQDSSL